MLAAHGRRACSAEQARLQRKTTAARAAGAHKARGSHYLLRQVRLRPHVLSTAADRRACSVMQSPPPPPGARVALRSHHRHQKAHGRRTEAFAPARTPMYSRKKSKLPLRKVRLARSLRVAIFADRRTFNPGHSSPPQTEYCTARRVLCHSRQERMWRKEAASALTGTGAGAGRDSRYCRRSCPAPTRHKR